MSSYSIEFDNGLELEATRDELEIIVNGESVTLDIKDVKLLVSHLQSLSCYFMRDDDL